MLLNILIHQHGSKQKENTNKQYYSTIFLTAV